MTWMRTIWAANSRACKIETSGVRISQCTQMGPFRSMNLRLGVEDGEEGDGFGGTSRYCLATTPYTPKNSLLDGIDMAVEHVILVRGRETLLH